MSSGGATYSLSTHSLSMPSSLLYGWQFVYLTQSPLYIATPTTFSNIRRNNLTVSGEVCFMEFHVRQQSGRNKCWGGDWRDKGRSITSRESGELVEDRDRIRSIGNCWVFVLLWRWWWLEWGIFKQLEKEEDNLFKAKLIHSCWTVALLADFVVSEALKYQQNNKSSIKERKNSRSTHQHKTDSQ